MTLSAVISIRSFIRNSSRQFKLFSILLLLTVVIEIFAILWKLDLHDTCWWSYDKTNLWIYNAFLIIRFLFSIIFLYFTIEIPFWKKTIAWSIFPIVILFMVNYFFIQTPFKVNSYTVILLNIILIFSSLIYFKQVLDKDETTRLHLRSEIWITLGIFIYYTGTLPFFILFNDLITYGGTMINSFLFINDTLNIIMYSLYLIGFLCLNQTQK